MRAVPLAALPCAPVETSVASAWRCERVEKEGAQAPGTQQGRRRKEARAKLAGDAVKSRS